MLDEEKDMKKRYLKVNMEIVEFETEDVITTSNGTGEGGNEDDDEQLINGDNNRYIL